MKFVRHLIGLIECTLTAEHCENVIGVSEISFSCLLKMIQH